MVPLILTLRLDDASFQYFNGLRKAHFPPERNFLDAHLTLFHHLPHTDAVIHHVQTAASQVQAPLALEVSGLYKLGNGVAFRIQSEALLQLHLQLQQQWKPLLTRQDQQTLRPHITVQNKVHPTQALHLYQQLSGNFTPFTSQALGLELHAYLGGPWQLVAFYPFSS